ncbi:hypothetical protein QTP70_020797, partial [Hemibagrus guttatus]
MGARPSRKLHPKTYIMFTVIFVSLWLSLGDSMADSKEPLFTHKAVDE